MIIFQNSFYLVAYFNTYAGDSRDHSDLKNLCFTWHETFICFFLSLRVKWTLYRCDSWGWCCTETAAGPSGHLWVPSNSAYSVILGFYNIFPSNIQIPLERNNTQTWFIQVVFCVFLPNCCYIKLLLILEQSSILFCLVLVRLVTVTVTVLL